MVDDLQNTLAVKYQEILDATNNFTTENILGKGLTFLVLISDLKVVY